MSVEPAGYVLLVSPDRREILLDQFESGDSGYLSETRLAEPVPLFEHSRQAPLIIFASFADGSITHIADGKKGKSAGTGLVRLNILDLTPLVRPIGFEELRYGVSSRIQPHLDRLLTHGGILPPKTLGAFVDRISELDESVAGRLARFSERRREGLTRLREREKENLAFQKDTLGLALYISGISRDELLAWQFKEGSQRSFLDGLPGARVREDAMLLSDFSRNFGDERLDAVTNFSSKTFELRDNPSVRLTVIMANRLSLEEQTGTDLIYFNEIYRSFVMIQYKAMERPHGQDEFRWRSGDNFAQEIKRMFVLQCELRKIRSGRDPDGFRLSYNPFYLKFCPRTFFNPDEKSLIKGIYLPLGLWKKMDSAGNLKGPKGGNVINYRNVGRHINNTEFISLVSGSWVGTSIEQSAILGPLIRQVLSSGKTVTFALKHTVPKEYGERHVAA